MIKFLTFLKINKIPKKNWSSDKASNFKPNILTIAYLFIGLLLVSLGEGLLILSSIGNSPWRVLSEGISKSFDLSIGIADLFVSSFVLFLWIFLKEKPGFGTFMNLILVALVIELSSLIFKSPSSIILQFLTAIFSILLIGLGGSIYLVTNLGPGPRDGLMTGLTKVTNLPISVIRSSIEISVITIGWLLGGTFGISTLIFALCIGPTISLFLFIINKKK